MERHCAALRAQRRSRSGPPARLASGSPVQVGPRAGAGTGADAEARAAVSPGRRRPRPRRGRRSRRLRVEGFGSRPAAPTCPPRTDLVPRPGTRGGYGRTVLESPSVTPGQWHEPDHGPMQPTPSTHTVMPTIRARGGVGADHESRQILHPLPRRPRCPTPGDSLDPRDRTQVGFPRLGIVAIT